MKLWEIFVGTFCPNHLLINQFTPIDGVGCRSAKPLEEVDLWGKAAALRPSSTHPARNFATGTSKMTLSMDLIFIFLLGY